MTWDFTPPEDSDISDHGVENRSNFLQGRHIALLVCGGIAAIKAPLLARELRRHGARVTIYASQEALKYTTLDSLAWSSDQPVITSLSARSEHLDTKGGFDAYLVAPATYNAINKIAAGIADNVITTAMASALGKLERGLARVLIAPTMHGQMHNSILTNNMRALNAMGVAFIQPRQQCGKNNLPNIQTIAATLIRHLNHEKMKGRKILVTAGNTPVAIDGIRRISTIFKGRLGLEIALALYYNGADVDLLLSGSDISVPEYLNCIKVNSYDAYKETCITLAAEKNYDYAIFSAAVADYRPRRVVDGKIKSDEAEIGLELVRTEKVIDIFQQQFPGVGIISFKYEQKVTHDQLTSIARKRLDEGHLAVIATRDEDRTQSGEQVAYLFSPGHESRQATGKSGIARLILDWFNASYQ